MDLLTRWFRQEVVATEEAALKSFKSLYRVGFAVLGGSILFFLLSAIRVVQLPFLILGAMLQIDAILFFLYAGLIKTQWELARQLGDRPAG